MTLEEALRLRAKNPDEYIERSMQSMAVHVEAMLALQKKRRDYFRLWKQHSRPGEKGRRRKRVRYSGLRSGIHPAAFLRRERSVSLGRVER